MTHCHTRTPRNQNLTRVDGEDHAGGGAAHPHRLLENVDAYMPFVWEYARLNISNTVLSKRKLNALVTHHHVHGCALAPIRQTLS